MVLRQTFICLGKEYSKKVGILSDQESRIDHYDPTVDPTIANVFAACAFRFAHTLLPVTNFFLFKFLSCVCVVSHPIV